MHIVKRKKKSNGTEWKEGKSAASCRLPRVHSPTPQIHLLSNDKLFLLGFIAVFVKNFLILLHLGSPILVNIYPSVLEGEEFMLLHSSLFISCITFHLNLYSFVFSTYIIIAT